MDSDRFVAIVIWRFSYRQSEIESFIDSTIDL